MMFLSSIEKLLFYLLSFKHFLAIKPEICCGKFSVATGYRLKWITYLIIYMKRFLHSDWLRAVQFFLEQKIVNSVQKEETNQAFLLVNDQRKSQMANQIFCFQIKCTPWMAQLMVQFFPDCLIRVRSFCSTILKFFHVYY